MGVHPARLTGRPLTSAGSTDSLPSDLLADTRRRLFLALLIAGGVNLIRPNSLGTHSTTGPAPVFAIGEGRTTKKPQRSAPESSSTKTPMFLPLPPWLLVRRSSSTPPNRTLSCFPGRPPFVRRVPGASVGLATRHEAPTGAWNLTARVRFAAALNARAVRVYRAAA